MKLAAPVNNPENPNQTLLKTGYQLQAPVLRRLTDAGITTLFVEFPGLDDLDRHLAPSLSPERQQIYSQIRGAVKQSQTRARPAIPFREYVKSIKDMITALLAQGENPVYMDLVARMGDDAVGHATSVAHLSLLIALRMDAYLISERKRLPAHQAKDPTNLGLAAMLHDIGKAKMPKEIQSFHTCEPPTDGAQLKEYQTHSQISYDMVRGHIEASAASAILNHHQHFDGSGWPVPVTKARPAPSGKSIHIFARIIMIADLYDRLITPMPGGVKRSPIEALHYLRTEFGRRCDPEVVKTLSAICPPLPPGQPVTLTDDSRAVVVDIEQRNPYKPVVRRMSRDGRSLDGPPIELFSAAEAVKLVNGQPIQQFIPSDSPFAEAA